MMSFKDARNKVVDFCTAIGFEKPEVKYTLRESNGVKVVCKILNTTQQKKNTVIFHLDNKLTINKVKIIDAFGKVFTVGYEEFDDAAKALAS